jgi:hypothetical protein
VKIDLLAKEIDDKFVRENVFRLKKFLEALQILDGFWTFFEVDLAAAGTQAKIKHNLDFVPQDIILLSTIGDQKVYFNYVDFDSTYLYVTNHGPCRIRFLAGKYKDTAYGGSTKQYSFVAPW